MRPGKACLLLRQALLVSLAWIAACSALAEPHAANEPGTDAGPEQAFANAALFRASPESTLNFSPGIPGFDLRSVALSPAMRLPPGAYGSARNLHDPNVTAQEARDPQAAPAGWAIFGDGSLWSLVADVGTNRPNGEASSQDTRTSSLALMRRFSGPVPGLDALDVSLIAARESNDHGFRELANRSNLVHVSFQWTLLGMNWTAGMALRNASYDDSPFPEAAARKDRTGMFDLSAEWSLRGNQSIRLELNEVRNASSIPVYDNRFRQVAIVFRAPM
jgi:hypothetical protein